MRKFVYLIFFAVLLGSAAYFSDMGLPSGARRGVDERVEQAQIIERFELEGFDDSGERTWRLEGDHAHVGEKGDVFIEKSVRLNLSGGTDVFADKVFWQNNKSRFMTNRPVRIEHEGVEVDGIGAVGKLEDQIIQINQDVRMIIDAGTLVTSRGPMRIYRNENRAVLFRDVWILDERGSVSSNRMDAYFDPDDRKVIAVVAKGDVRISRGEDVTYAQLAVYDTRTGSVRLEGAPEIDIRNVDKLQDEYAEDFKEDI